MLNEASVAFKYWSEKSIHLYIQTTSGCVLVIRNHCLISTFVLWTSRGCSKNNRLINQFIFNTLLLSKSIKDLPMYFCTTYCVHSLVAWFILLRISCNELFRTIPFPRLLSPGFIIQTFLIPSIWLWPRHCVISFIVLAMNRKSFW